VIFNVLYLLNLTTNCCKHNLFFKFSELNTTTGLNNGKIIIKDLKESRLYQELVNEVQEKEQLKTEKYENSDQNKTHDLDKKKKRGCIKLIKNI